MRTLMEAGKPTCATPASPPAPRRQKLTRRQFASGSAALLTCGAFPLVANAQGSYPAVLNAALRWASIPGVSLAAINAQTIHAWAFGLRDRARNLPVTNATIFEAASCSKPVFAYGVLQLVQQHALDLDRPLDSYLASPYPIDDPRGQRITARHVLTHTSGLPNWRDEKHPSLALAFEPGTQYRYSGEGFYFLQTVVEAITGLSTERFMRGVLDRLGMHTSSYVWRERFRADAAAPYGQHLQPLSHDTAIWGEQLIAMGVADGRPLAGWTTADALAALHKLHPAQVAVPHNAMPNAAWSLLTTATDYARFVQALLHDPSHPMLRPVLRITDYIWRGLGIVLQKNGNELSFFHTGSNPGFKAVMFGDLRRGRGVVSFANSDNGFALNMHVLEHELGDQPAIYYLEGP